MKPWERFKANTPTTTKSSDEYQSGAPAAGKPWERFQKDAVDVGPQSAPQQSRERLGGLGVDVPKPEEIKPQSYTDDPVQPVEPTRQEPRGLQLASDNFGPGAVRSPDRDTSQFEASPIWSDRARDFAGTAGKAFTYAGQSAYGLANLASYADPGRMVASAIENLTGTDIPVADTIAQSMERRGLRPDFGRTSEFFESLKSDALQARGVHAEESRKARKERGDNFAQRAAGSALDLLSDPVYGAVTLAEQVPSLLTVGGATRQAVASLGTAATNALRRKVGEIAALGAGGGVEAGAAASQAAEDIYGSSEKELNDSPLYRDLRVSKTHEQARSELAERTGAMAGTLAGGISILTGRLTGAARFESDIFNRIPGGSAKKLLAGTFGAATKEGVQGFFEEGGSQLSQNLARDQAAQLETDWLKNVPEDAGAGAVIEAALGGGARAISPSVLTDMDTDEALRKVTIGEDVTPKEVSALAANKYIEFNQQGAPDLSQAGQERTQELFANDGGQPPQKGDSTLKDGVVTNAQEASNEQQRKRLRLDDSVDGTEAETPLERDAGRRPDERTRNVEPEHADQQPQDGQVPQDGQGLLTPKPDSDAPASAGVSSDPGAEFNESLGKDSRARRLSGFLGDEEETQDWQIPRKDYVAAGGNVPKHRKAIFAAINAGEDVPDAVLSGYPDLVNSQLKKALTEAESKPDQETDKKAEQPKPLAPKQVTRGMREDLSDLGYTKADIGGMQPDLAVTLIAEQKSKPGVDSSPSGKAKKRAEKNRRIDNTKDDVITAIRKLGGVNTDLESDWRGRLSHLDQNNRQFGLPSIEQKGNKGLALDELTERLAEEGYFDFGENAYDQTELAELLSVAESGEPVFGRAPAGDAYAEQLRADNDLSRVDEETQRRRKIEALTGKPEPEPTEDGFEPVGGGIALEEVEYNPAWTGEQRTYQEWQQLARGYNNEAVEGILEKEVPEEEIVRRFAEVIEDGRKREEGGGRVSTPPVQGESELQGEAPQETSPEPRQADANTEQVSEQAPIESGSTQQAIKAILDRADTSVLPSIGYLQAKKGSDSQYRLFYVGTANELLPGESFRTAAEARNWYKALVVKQDQSTSTQPGLTLDEKGAPTETPETDLLGVAPASEQQTADERRKRDEKRNPNKDVSADTGGGLFSNEQKQRDIEDAAPAGNKPGGSQDGSLNSRLGKTVFGRYSDLGSEPVPLSGAIDDIAKIIGFESPFDIIENNELDEQTPALYNLATGKIEINPNIEVSRAQAAQHLVEEVLHGIDHLGRQRTLSASTAKFDAQLGKVGLEASKHYLGSGPLADFLKYPLADKQLTRSETKAELFSRLGVVYLGDPLLMRDQLPAAYEVFHEIFRLDTQTGAGSDSAIFGKVWAPTKKPSENGSESDGVRQPDARDVGFGRSGQRPAGRRGLEELRDAVSKAINAKRSGARVQFSQLKSRNEQAPTTRQTGQLYDYTGAPFNPDPESLAGNRPLLARPITREEADKLRGLSGVFRVSTRGPETTGQQGWFVDPEAAKGEPRPTMAQRRIISGAQSRETVEFSVDTSGDGTVGTYQVLAPGSEATPRTEYDEPLFSKSADKAPRNLYVAHNLSAENLKAANELGGLAAPSLAVANIDKGAFDNFGEITLLAEPSLLESSKARTFDADVYTPRQPRATNKINTRAYDKFLNELKVDAPGMNRPDEDVIGRDGAEAIARSAAVKYQYLKSLGKAPKPARRKAGREIRAAAKNPASLEEQARKYYQREYDEIVNAEDMDPTLRGMKLEVRGDWFEDNGDLSYRAINDFESMARNYRNSGGIDTFKTEAAVNRKLRNKTLQAGLEKRAQEIAERITEGKVLFNGFSYDGSRKRYKSYDMQTVLREMTRSVQGGENYFYGAGSIRAKYAAELKSIKAIQKRRDDLVSAQDIKDMKDESGERLTEVLDELKPYYKFNSDRFGYLDDAGTAIAEGPRGWNEAFNLDADSRKIITDLVEYLRGLPTEYFETKIGRAVGLQEFNTAVVPRGTDADTIDLLKSKGLKLRYYTQDKTGDRARAIRGAGKQILFSQSKGTQAQPGLPAAKVKLILGKPIADLRKRLDIPVRIVDTRPEAMEYPASAQGVYRGNEIIIFAPNIRDAEHAREVLRHEVVGHYSMEQMLGPLQHAQISKAILKAKASNGDIARVAQEVRERYGDQLDKIALEQGQDKADQVEAAEIIAVSAEQGVDHPLIERILAAIKQFLRRIGLIRGEVTDTELRGLLARAGRYNEKQGSRIPHLRLSPAFNSNSAPIFHSQMQRVLAEKLPGKGQSTAMAEAIRAFAKKGQIKQDEIDESGILEWLDEPKRAVTKDEVLAYAREMGVMVEETVLDEPDNLSLEQAIEIGASGGAVYAVLKDSPTKVGSALLDNGEILPHIEKNPGNYFLRAGNADAVIRGSEGPKYSGYTFPGGKDYKEILIQLPENTGGALSQSDFEIKQEAGKYSVYRKGNPKSEAWVGTQKEAEDYIAGEVNRNSDSIKRRNNYQSSHFDQPNILAHIRFNERTDADGKRVLFIEEVQADKGQEWRDLNKAIEEGSATEGDKARFKFLDENFPFNQTNSWALLALKRAIRYASDNGFDRVAWTTGSTQAARYNDQVQKIEHIAWEKNDDGTYNISAPLRDSNEPPVYKEDLTEKELRDLVGKDIAEKIAKGEGRVDEDSSYRDWRILEGDDLTIGGQGMVGFYDRMLPSIANKYIKKWGSRTSTTSISTNELNLTDPEQEIDLWRAFEPNGDMYATAESESEINKLMPEGGFIVEPGETAVMPADTQVHSFDVTDSMRDTVMSAGQPLFSRSGPRPTTKRSMRSQDVPQSAEEAMRKAGFKLDNRGLGERARDYFETVASAFSEDMINMTKQGMFDRFHSIKLAEQRVLGRNIPAEQSAYVAARLSTGMSSTMRAMLLHGAPEMRDGIIQYKENSRGLLEVLEPVKEDIDAWLGWMVGRRADRLMQEGRENNFTQSEIDDLLALSQGREERFQQAADEYNDYKTAVLDLAQASGLIDGETRPAWDMADHIPFFRADKKQGESKGPFQRKGMSHQESGIRTLRGGESELNDPLENIILNFTHLVDASMKNEAMLRVVDNLKGSDFISPVGQKFAPVMVPMDALIKDLEAEGVVVNALPEEAIKGLRRILAMHPPTDKDVVRVMVGGKAKFFKVNDPGLVSSLTAIDEKALPLGLFRYFKRLLTGSVTADPSFIMRNFMRDTLHAWTISDDAFIPIVDSFKGLANTLSEGEGTRSMMFAGGSFQGGYLNANDPGEVARSIRRSLRSKGYSAASADDFLGTIIDRPARLWEMYRHLGDAVENANREAVYKAATNAGKSKAQAVFEAKDLMDYSMRGNWAIIQALTDMVPFLNARLQGLYKLGRAGAIPGPGMRLSVAMRGSVIIGLTAALYALNKDDDRYEELEEWDKDLYWHFWLPDEIVDKSSWLSDTVNRGHMRIPKPFEIGLIYGTLPERIIRGATGRDDLAKTGERVAFGFLHTLSFNPTPQLVAPPTELWANKSFFTSREIEGTSDQGVLTQYRYSAFTSDTARWMSKLGGSKVGLSPKEIEHLVEGYVATMGGYALTMSDLVVRGLEGKPARPSMTVRDIPLLNSIFRGNATPYRTRYITELYDAYREASQINRTVNELDEQGRPEEANRLLKKNRVLYDERKWLNKSVKEMGEINGEIDDIYRHPSMTSEEKTAAIEKLHIERNRLAKQEMEALERAEN